MNMYLNSLILSVYFIVIKWIYSRTISKDVETNNKLTKQLIRDFVMVYTCSILGYLTINHLGDFLGLSCEKVIPVFVKDPEF